MGMPGGFELIIIFLVVLLVFGAKRIPEIARGVGKGIREFKDATNDIKSELEQGGQSHPKPPRRGTPQARSQRGPEQGEYDASGSAEREPAHQEAGRPASAQSGPPEPARADNPGEETKSSSAG